MFRVLLPACTLLAALPVFGAPVKAKTLHCEVSYGYTDAAGKWTVQNIQGLKVKLAKDPTVTARLTGKFEIVTEDGVYKVGMYAMQPLKGDLTKFENILITAFNQKTQVNTISGDFIVTWMTEHRYRAALTINENYDKDMPTGPSLGVQCNLKEK